jgi:hypothetical protein
MTMPDFERDADFDPELDDRLLAPVELPQQRTTARGALIVGARIATGTIGLVVAAAVVAAAGLLPLPTFATTSPVTVVTPVVAEQQRVCAGSLLRLGNDQGEGATTASSVGKPLVRYSSSAGQVQVAPLTSTDSTSGLAPMLLTLPPEAETTVPPLLVGSQEQAVNSGDLVGLASAECTEANGDSWLAGGATDTGRTSILTLSNPSTVVATVKLSIFAETGAVSAAGTDGIVVPPGGQRVLSLAGFAPDVLSPVVHVESRGGQIVANLQEVVVRTLDPGGVDIVSPTRQPSKRAVVPGLVLAGSAALAPAAAQDGYSDLRAAVRLFVPGTKGATVALTILAEDGTSKPNVVNLSVPAGIVTDVPLDSFPDGAYSLAVDSDVPLLAAARVSTMGASGATDFDWLAAGTPLTDKAIVPVGSGPSPVLHLVNLSKTDATISLRGHGTSTTVKLPAGAAIATPVSASTTYTLSGFDSVVAAVSYLGDGTIASFGVTPTAPTSQPITVHP